ncbi:MAG: flagellar assembly peptidoglycan hydrolase FlgJ [Pseudomonadota bacterium]
MVNGVDLASKFALDVQGVNALKLEARQATPEALRATAQQFEAVFLNMLMKSMREATPQDGMFDSEQTRMYTAMLDQQLTQKLASRGIGLAEVMVRQLSVAMQPPAVPGEGPAQPIPLQREAPAIPLKPDGLPFDATPVGPAASSPRAGLPAHVDAFVQRLLPHAQQASAATGIPARFMLGQAALETGWGRHEMRGADGANSHNLFGIKAGSNWKGRTVDMVTTEYVDGKAQKQVERFRAYDSYAESFRDYASLLRNNARYQNVIAEGRDAAGFAHGLQRAGYATDPNYAQKLLNVIGQFDRA